MWLSGNYKRLEIFCKCAKNKKTEYASDVESKRAAIEASIEAIIEMIG